MAFTPGIRAMSKLRLDDFRIKYISWAPSEYMPNFDRVEVGEDGITTIDAFEQCLGTESICWLQAWRDDQLLARFNAKNIDTIGYFDD